ncbi:MAG: flagellar basal body P-ring protein FlgI [Myxococcales bacterium]|nr:flagellar basal body P-ring protein FlgI [Myxococcales bacterium]
MLIDRCWTAFLGVGLLLSLVVGGEAEAVRLKDLVEVKGVRGNLLTGYGLVVGLPGTGDSRRTIFTAQAVSTMLLRHGVTVDPSIIDITNVAAVMITAELPAFASGGDKIDVQVSALGDARSLASGTLIRTSLRGPDGETYGLAQGPVTVGGFGISNALLNVRRNNPTTARIPGGAIVEKSISSEFVKDNVVVLILKEQDFTTAERLVDAINGAMQGEVATALNSGQVQVQVPAAAQKAPVAFISQLEAIDVIADSKARVVINEGTGTVVIGGKVTLGAAAVAHGNLNIAVVTQLGVSQPPAFAKGGSTVVVPNAGVTIEEDQGDVVALPTTATVDELVQALNSLGASARDLMAIFQALKRAGALNGELEIL